MHRKSFHSNFAVGIVKRDRSERREFKRVRTRTDIEDRFRAIQQIRYQRGEDGRHRINALHIKAYHLHIMYLYNRILENPNFNPPARTYIFGAKAASGYRRAKTIIKLINTVAERINNDRRVKGKLRVVFVENYRVSMAEKLFPASDVSEQISTAGKEASGTSNMKFMMNGALTLGTMDGANIEIVEEAGAENAFIFGLTSDEILKIEREHNYNPQKYLDRNPHLAKVMNQLIDGTYDPTCQLFKEIYDSLIYGVEGQRPDVYYVLADFDAYVAAQEKIAEEYQDRTSWARKAILNIARSGKFSSDRTIEDYVRDIWKLEKLVF